jgi:hypothetical protein
MGVVELVGHPRYTSNLTSTRDEDEQERDATKLIVNDSCAIAERASSTILVVVASRVRARGDEEGATVKREQPQASVLTAALRKRIHLCVSILL